MRSDGSLVHNARYSAAITHHIVERTGYSSAPWRNAISLVMVVYGVVLRAGGLDFQVVSSVRVP